jgi:dTDP-4-amino-4,6-dideoxygalactose transaminase
MRTKKSKMITFITTGISILLKGTEPIFMDFENNGFTLVPKMKDEVKDKDVSAIMPAHVYGLPSDDNSMEQRVER